MLFVIVLWGVYMRLSAVDIGENETVGTCASMQMHVLIAWMFVYEYLQVYVQVYV